MTRKRTPQRGNPNIGKDGVRNPGRFAPKHTVSDDPAERLTQIGEKAEAKKQLYDEFLMENEVDLNQIESTIRETVREVFDAHGDKQPEVIVNGNEVKIVENFDENGSDMFGACPFPLEFVQEAPETWVETYDDSDTPYLLGDDDPYSDDCIDSDYAEEEYRYETLLSEIEDHPSAYLDMLYATRDDWVRLTARTAQRNLEEWRNTIRNA